LNHEDENNYNARSDSLQICTKLILTFAVTKNIVLLVLSHTACQ